MWVVWTGARRRDSAAWCCSTRSRRLGFRSDRSSPWAGPPTSRDGCESAPTTPSPSRPRPSRSLRPGRRSLTGRVETLSGGEHRRVAVARALESRPHLLLLDEPAAFLDVRHRLELEELLADVVAREQMACLVAMHDLDSAARWASHVVLLREGHVVAWRRATATTLRATFDAEVSGVHERSPLLGRLRSAAPAPSLRSAWRDELLELRSRPSCPCAPR